MSARVEGKYVVPAGTTVSVSNGAQTSATAVTWTAGNYYDTAAGGVSSGITVLHNAINAAVGPYPDNASAVAAMLGYGTWTAGAGWLCQEASGDLAASFGAPTLADVSTPSYRNAGAGFSTDYAVGFDSDADAFTGGNVFDVGATDDLVVAMVVKFSTVTGNDDILGKGFVGGVGAGYAIDREGALVAMYVNDGVDAQLVSAAVAANTWYCLIAALDRTNNQIRIGVCPVGSASPVVSSTASTTSVGTLSSANAFNLGDNGTHRAGGQVSALYVVEGSGVAGTIIANMSTALTNFAAAIGSSWTVSQSTTTGLSTISHSFWPMSVAFTSAAAGTKLGFAYGVDYPQTAAQMATAVGYGDFTNGVGYLCNETSGNLAAVFGTPATLTAVSTPTYSNVGARGADLAVGFNSAADAFDGGDALDLYSTTDLVVVWVARFSSAPASIQTLITKCTSGAGWQILAWNDGTYRFRGFNAAAAQLFSATSASIHAGSWHVGIAVVDRSTGKARIGTYALNTGTSSVSSEVTPTVDASENAVAFRLGDDAAGASSGVTTAFLSAVYATAGTSVATGLSANLSTALSSFATYMKSQTSTAQAKGLVFLDCPLNLDGDPSQAPRVSDLRTTMSPTGITLGLAGNKYFQHTGLVWSHVPRDRVWESAATYDNGSWETFFLDTQMGFGHSWFVPASPIQIYYESAGSTVLLGADYNGGTGLAGWTIVNVASIEPKKSIEGWTGLFRIELPRIVSSG